MQHAVLADRRWRDDAADPRRASAALTPAIRQESALHAEQVEADAEQDDEEHHPGHGRAHRRVAQLELEPEERAVEERAQQVGAEVGTGQAALDGVDQVEGVEVADEREDGDDADRRAR